MTLQTEPLQRFWSISPPGLLFKPREVGEREVTFTWKKEEFKALKEEMLEEYLYFATLEYHFCGLEDCDELVELSKVHGGALRPHNEVFTLPILRYHSLEWLFYKIWSRPGLAPDREFWAILPVMWRKPQERATRDMLVANTLDFGPRVLTWEEWRIVSDAFDARHYIPRKRTFLLEAAGGKGPMMLCAMLPRQHVRIMGIDRVSFERVPSEALEELILRAKTRHETMEHAARSFMEEWD